MKNPDMNIVYAAVGGILKEQLQGVTTRIGAAENSAALSHEQASQQIDALADRLASISRDADNIRSDTRSVRADTMEEVRSIGAKIDERVTAGVKTIGEFRELTSEQIGAFADTLTEVSASMEEQTATLLELADTTQKEGVERGDALREELGAQIKRVAEQAATEFAQIKTFIASFDQDEFATKGALTDLGKHAAEQLTNGLVETNGKIGTAVAELDAQITARTEGAIAGLAASLASYKVEAGEAFTEYGEEWEQKLQASSDRVAECLEKLVTQGEGLAAHDKLIEQIFTKSVEHTDNKVTAVRAELDVFLGETRSQFETVIDKIEGAWSTITESRDAWEKLTANYDEEKVVTDDRFADVARLTKELRDAVKRTTDELDLSKEGTARLVEGLSQSLTESRAAWEKLTANCDEEKVVTDERFADVARLTKELRDAVKQTTDELNLSKEGTALLVEGLSQSLTELRDERDDDVVRIEERITEQGKTAGDQAQSLREQVTAAEETVARKVDQLIEDVEKRLDTDAEEFSRFETEVKEQISTGEQAVQHRIAEARRETMSSLKDVIRDDLHSNIVNARGWDAEGPAYKAHEFVWHRNGLWQARASTTQEPGLGHEWQCLVNSFYRSESFATATGQPMVRLEFSHGRADEFALGSWCPSFKKTWNPNEDYDLWDVVTRDFNRYIAIVPHPKGDPKVSEDWALFAMRGLKGRKGEPGRPPQPEEITKALVSYMEQGDGVPVRAFRGSWRYQTQYQRGDVIVYGESIMIAEADDDGSVPPGMLPGGQVNKHWKHVFSIQLPKMPPNMVVYEPNYEPGVTTVPKYTQVQRNGWLMISNKATGDTPDPQGSGDPSTDLPDIVDWDAADPEFAGVAWAGHQYTLTQPGFVQRLEAQVPELTDDTSYRFLLSVQKPTDENPFIKVAPDPILLVNDWAALAVADEPLPAGTVVTFIIDALNSGSQTEWQHEWTYAGTEGGAQPDAGDWNRRNQHDELRISFTADDGDRFAELNTIIVGSTIRCSSVANLNQFWEYRVNRITQEAASFEFDVDLVSIGTSGGVPEGQMSLVAATIPLPQLTKYKRNTDYWVANEPAWANVIGVERLGGVDQTGVEDNAYGVRVQFQPAYVSPDWDFLAYTP